MHANMIELNFLYCVLAPFTFVNPYIVNYGMMWLVFRVMLSCGIGKYVSKDVSWRNLRAMDYHYFTQPLPNPLSPFMHRLPKFVHTFEVIATFAIEGPICFLIFLPFETPKCMF